jgi:hypothetical protein
MGAYMMEVDGAGDGQCVVGREEGRYLGTWYTVILLSGICAWW